MVHMQPRHRTPHLLALLLTSVAALGGCGDVQPGQVVARGDAPEPGPTTGAPAALPKPADGGVLVDVAGLVRRPGVYRLPAGARVHEAIAASGGTRRGAQLGVLNRAATLVDGQQVLVQAGEPIGTAAASGSSAATRTVSINTSDVAALDSLPGIGPVTAERIVAERTASGPFANIDDLDRVPGIGPATVEALRDVATT